MDAWLCCGDFNEIMWNAEKKGGRLKSSSNMNIFRDVFKKCNLRDLGFTGSPFTWSNGRRGADNVLERLDRASAINEWLDRFMGAIVRHLPYFKSDHSPIVFLCKGDRIKSIQYKSCGFKLKHMRLQHQDFGKMV